jgi:hypothetical protein
METYSVVAHGALLLMWIFRLNYMINHLLIKISILLFYCYIASTHRSFNRIVRLMLTVVALSSLAMMLTSIFICYPISDAWSTKVFLDGSRGIYKATS